jgi:hypothetical protein
MPVGEDRSADHQRRSRDRTPGSRQEHPDHRAPAIKAGLLRRAPRETHLNCPRCGLGIAQTARSRPFGHCPRCLGRARIWVELFASTLRAEQLHADGAPCAGAGSKRDANDAKPEDKHTDRTRRPGRVRPGSAANKRLPAIDPAAGELLGAGPAAASFCCVAMRSDMAAWRGLGGRSRGVRA